MAGRGPIAKPILILTSSIYKIPNHEFRNTARTGGERVKRVTNPGRHGFRMQVPAE